MTQIPSVNPVDPALRGNAASQFSELTSQDFIRIMFTELSNQDPFQPNDSAALLEQLNSIRSIESDIQLVEKLESLVLENQLSGAAGMIGKVVEGLGMANDRISGVVVSVSKVGDDIELELDSGRRLPLDRLETIYE